MKYLKINRSIGVKPLLYGLVAQGLIMTTPYVSADLLEEIIVTVQKREQSLQDVGISVTAFSGKQMDAFGFQDSVDVVSMTPGVNANGSLGGQWQSFNIRGVTQLDFADIAESPNAVYVDEAYISMANRAKFALLDLERVEILKGPQGTLFGRNATGGLVHYISRKPTEEFEGNVEITYGSYDQTRLEGAVSGPLTDNLRGRAALLYNRHEEIFDNQVSADDEWNDNTVAGRVQLEWDINEKVKLWTSVYGGRSDMSTGPYQGIPTIAQFDGDGNVINSFHMSPTETRAGIGPGGTDVCPGCFFPNPGRPVAGADGYGYLDPDDSDLDVSKDFTDEDGNVYGMYGVTGKLTREFDKFMLTTLVDYKTIDTDDVKMDTDATPNNVMAFHADAESDQLSLEVRLDGESERVRWVTGLYYLNFDVESTQGISQPDTPVGGTNIIGLANLDFTNSADLETESISLFGQIEYDLTEALVLTAGLRVVSESKDFKHRADLFTSSGVLLVPFFESAANPLPNTQNLDSDETLWSGKLQLDWHLKEDLLVYAGINRGVKAQGFNQQLSGLFTVEQYEYEPEILSSYEIGFKSSVFNDRARFNGAFYYYDYEDYQAHASNNLLFTVINADANFYGFELDLATSPIDGLDLMLGVSYIDTEVEDVPFVSGPSGSGQKRFADVEAPYTPQLQLAGMVRYEWHLQAGGTMAAQVDVNYSDSFYSNITNFDSTELDSYTVGNARLTYTSQEERWQVDLFAKNVADERYEQIGFDFSASFGSSIRSFGMPRWYGVSLKYNWR